MECHIHSNSVCPWFLASPVIGQFQTSITLIVWCRSSVTQTKNNYNYSSTNNFLFKKLGFTYFFLIFNHVELWISSGFHSLWLVKCLQTCALIGRIHISYWKTFIIHIYIVHNILECFVANQIMNIIGRTLTIMIMITQSSQEVRTLSILSLMMDRIRQDATTHHSCIAK